MNKDYLIIANGPFLVKEIIQEAAIGKKIVALDGAANKLKRLNIKPDVILGDFDSIHDIDYWGIHADFNNMHDCTIPYLGKAGIIVVPRKDQARPDLIKAIHYCDKQGAKSITLVCALGGRLDLHETTLRSLRNEYRKSRHIILHTEQHSIQFICNEKVTIQGEIGDHCAILAYPNGNLTTTGLLYNVKNYDLAHGKADSICNTLLEPKVDIQVDGEALVIMPPQLQSQRKFMQLNEREKLKLQLRDLE